MAHIHALAIVMGRKHTDEARAKMRAHVRTPEHNRKISESRRGHPTHCMPHTAEGKANISAALTGRKLSEETKAKMSLAHRRQK